MVTYAVFLRIGEIGMRRTEYVFHVVVIVGMLVGVPYDKSDGASCRYAFVNAGKEFHLIGLFAGRGDGRLSRSATDQFLLNEIHIDGDACGKSVDDAAYSFSV